MKKFVLTYFLMGLTYEGQSKFSMELSHKHNLKIVLLH